MEISKARIKWIRRLHHKKFRNDEGLFIAEGEKVVDELLSSDYRIHSLYATEQWFNDVDVEITGISNKDLEEISLLDAPNKVLAVVHYPDNRNSKIQPALILDDIKDPGNMGTLIRIAHWFGIDQVICSSQSVDYYNPKVIQSSMGSVFHINLFNEELLSFFKRNSDTEKLPVYAAVLDGTSIYKAELDNNSMLIIGNESRGITEELKDYVTQFVSIPSFAAGKNGAESLNAAVAAGVIISEMRRQKKIPL